MTSTPFGSASRGRRYAIVAGAWIALVAVVLAVAAALDTPPGEPEVASVPEGLPPLTLTLDRELPASVVAKPSIPDQIEELRRLATEGNDAARWVELGAVEQRLQQYADAGLAYRRALAIEPTRLDARVGTIMLDAVTDAGRDRAAGALATLRRTNPTSQLVAFNEGMVAVYRRDAETVRSAFAATERLGPTTPLGVLARRFGSAATGNASP